jgi:uncharacterized membrane protein YkvI
MRSRPFALAAGCVVFAVIWTAGMTVMGDGPVTVGSVIGGLLLGIVVMLVVSRAMRDGG